MMQAMDWDARLSMIAKEMSDADGPVGDQLRARLARHSSIELALDIQFAHARARQAVVTGVQMAHRCGTLLFKAPAGEMASWIQMTGISPSTAKHYLSAALAFPELCHITERRRGKITEAQALAFLRGGQLSEQRQSDPVTDLRALLKLLESPEVPDVAG